MAIQQSLRTTIETIKADFLTPVKIFKRLQGPYKFLLESSSKYEESGRYSFIGANPRKTYFSSQSQLHDLTHDTEKLYTYDGDLIQLLKQVMPRVSSLTEFPFIGGGVGYIRYGAGTPNLQDEQMPEVQFHIYDTLIIFDHIKDEVTIVHTNIAAEHKTTDIESIIEQIQVGDIVNHSFELNELQKQADNSIIASFIGDTFELYRQLRIKIPGAYMYFIEFDGFSIIGSSKDSFISVNANNVTATNDPYYKEALTKVMDDLHEADLLSGQLQVGLHSLDALQTMLPPKLTTADCTPLKAYGSVLGYIGFNGQIDFTLANKVITIENDKLYATAETEQFDDLLQIFEQLRG